MLVENGGKVGFGNIISKRTITENAGHVTYRGKLFMPGDNPLRQRLHLLTGDLLGKAGD